VLVFFGVPIAAVIACVTVVGLFVEFLHFLFGTQLFISLS